MEIFNTFNTRFNKNVDLEKASEADIENLNKQLNIIVPKDFRLFLTKFGNIYTPNILDIIVDKDIELPVIQEFWPTENIINDKQNEWTAHLSTDLIPFASDSMGNIFGFLAADLQEERETCSVHFFNHDYDTVEKVSNSFSEWIESYNRI